jgi:cytosine/adenosine deaminase-related metal-dependent hydrolase
MDDDHTVVPDGRVLVSQGKIAAIWSGASPPPGIDLSGAKTIDAGPDALIFPGLINLHDHPTYGALPLWPPPSSHAQPEEGRPLGTEPYSNRYQWAKTTPEHGRLVENPQTALVESLGMFVDVLKHTEVRSVLGGQTASQGSSGDPATADWLVRNVDGVNFGRDRIEARVPDVNDEGFASAAMALHDRMQAGQVDAWLVHLAEGVRDSQRPPGDTFSSRHELDVIADLGVLTDATAVLHGMALERDDFATMRAAPPAGTSDGLGAKLVWSPLSNLLLYGRTAEVYDALAEDVTISLGTDWTSSGSNSLLQELKIADIALRDPLVLGDSRPDVPSLADEETLDRALVDMVTRNPARTLHWSEVGTIETGKVADLMMLRKPEVSPTGGMPDSPYRSLIDATERDVALVLVGGDPLAGDVGPMTALRGRDFETINSPEGGFTKAIDVTKPGVPKGRQRLASVERRLTDGLRALGGDGASQASGLRPADTTYSYLRKRFNGGRYLLTDDAAFRDEVLAPMFGRVGTSINLERIELKPFFSHDDDFFFAMVGGVIDPVTGLADDPTPPFHLYTANFNHSTISGDAYDPDRFFERWYAP